MKLTPSQVREIAGISQETLRYWRTKLAPLNGRSGHRACFTLAEALALRIVSSLKDMGISVGALMPTAPELFRILANPDWDKLEVQHLQLNMELSQICLVDLKDRETISASSVVLLVPLADHVQHVQRMLLGSSKIAQNDLRFRPVALRKQRTS